MKFDELDEKMRVYETALDYCVLPEMFMVARIDGRGFTRLTREVHQFQSPFDDRFRDMMVLTAEHLMNDKPAVNPTTGEEVVARRRRIKVDYELPMKDLYSDFILRLIEISIESE